MSVSEQRRCGLVAICGAPNAGKSTLLNRMVGAKISIVTPKVQTTRARLLAIALEGQSQIVFVDTPGVFAAKRPAERAMVDAAWRAVEDADVALVLVDAARAVRGAPEHQPIDLEEREPVRRRGELPLRS